MIAMRIGTPPTPTTPGSTGGIVRRHSSTGAGDSHHVRNTFTRAGSAAMISPAGKVLRPRATIGVADEAGRLISKRRSSRTRTAQRLATIDAPEMREVSGDALFDREKGSMRPLDKPNGEANSPGSDSLAVSLARKHRLTLAETRNVVNAFKDAKKNSTGGIDMADFRAMMCRVFDVSEINTAVLVLAHKQAGMQQSANLDDFMAWYVQNMFTQVNALNANQDLHQGNSLTYTLSEKHMVSVSVIDKIKAQFDKFDLDKSGEIDFAEFTEMMCILLKTNKDALSDVRLKKFWREIEKVTTGDVGFVGFAAWYLKYFNPDPNCEEDGPVEAMYASFNPTLQRQSFLENLVM